jgi:hypothetical protein
MSATSKLVGFSATEQDEDDDAPRVDRGRRRYLMRFVVVALGLAGLICVAAGVRIAKTRSAAAQEDAVPALSLRPLAVAAAPAAPAAQTEPPASVATAAVAVRPEVAAAPPPLAPAALPAKAMAPASSTQTAPTVHARPAPAPAAPRPQAHPASAIVHAAPF